MDNPGRNEPCPCGSGRRYKHCCGAERPPAPSDAEAQYRLGNTLRDQGRLHDAIARYAEAISLEADHAEAHNNLGTALHALGNLGDAIASYRKAVSANPRSPFPYYNLGNALKDQGDVSQAITCYVEALSLKPDFAQAHTNLGMAYQAAGELPKAIASYRRALSLDPTIAEACYGLGTALTVQGHLADAIVAYRAAVSLRPADAHAHHELGNALSMLGQLEAALASHARALALHDAPEYRTSFALCVRNAHFIRNDPEIRSLVARALSEAWVRPEELVSAGIALLERDDQIGTSIGHVANTWPARSLGAGVFDAAVLARLSHDALLRSLLESAPVTDIPLERFLTAARRALLDDAIRARLDGDATAEPAAFHCALARQCLINDFIFSCTGDELECVSSLRNEIVDALEREQPIAALQIVAVAAYFPLLTLPAAEPLLHRRWPEAVNDLLLQHIAEPLQERRYRSAIPKLTGVNDSVSRAVRQQYEDNPYPRWVKLPPAGEALSLAAYVHRHFPLAPRVPDHGMGIDILVAGCGTGRESIELARQFHGARVTAVDLSLSSLCYAKRKSVELGLPDIGYAQGDILALQSMEKTFDLVASVGVLHHLAAPLEGWRTLLALLRPGGCMLLGLYSEHARRSVVAARAFIAERGYASTPAGIRQCREELMALPDAAFREVTAFSDFYVTSECRDLLFHVQEQCFTLPQIKAALDGFGLSFVGFFLEPAAAKKYAQRFPNDPAKTDLDCWNDFENEFPATFAGMYVFLVRKR